MATDFQKQVRTALEDSFNIRPDRIICKKDGSVVVKKGYFYRHGTSGSNWAARVEAELVDKNLRVYVEGTDDWKAWPATSYFVATVTQR